MSKAIAYRCPNCAAPVEYDIAEGLVLCQHCGSTFHPEQLEDAEYGMGEIGEPSGFHAIAPDDFLDRAPWGTDEGRQDNLICHECPSCGARIMTDATSVTSGCPYCGHNIEFRGMASRENLPQLIVPFAIDGQTAGKALLDYCQHKWYLPSGFKAELEHAVAMYIPYRIFGFQVEGDATCIIPGISENHQSVYRAVKISGIEYLEYYADASSKMPDALMDSIAPFDISAAIPFKPSYAAGFLMEIADEEESEDKAQALNTVLDFFRVHLQRAAVGAKPGDGIGECELVTYIPQASLQSEMFCLLPVWIWHYSHHGEDILFAVNGQTGQVAGNLPISLFKQGLTYLPIAAFIAVVLLGMFSFFLNGGASGGIGGTIVVAIIIAFFCAFLGVLFFAVSYRRDRRKTRELRSARTTESLGEEDAPDSDLEITGFQILAKTEFLSTAYESLASLRTEQEDGRNP